MILDPYIHGCNVWHGNKVVTIKGEPAHVCNEIYKRIVIPKQTVSGRYKYDQLYDIQVDIGGIGKIYCDILSDMGLNYTEIRGGRIEDILPVRCENVQWRTRKEFDNEFVTKFF